MDLKQYVNECLRTDMPNGDYTPVSNRLAQNNNLTRLMHTALGISGEAGEIADIVKKCVTYGKPVDKAHLTEECGDLLWYMANMLHALNVSFDDVLKQNVEKLRKRYPVGFTEQAALERKDKV